MSTYQIYHWQSQCDLCGDLSEVEQGVTEVTPEGWQTINRTRAMDDKYAPISYTVLVCPECLAEYDESGNLKPGARDRVQDRIDRRGPGRGVK